MHFVLNGFEGHLLAKLLAAGGRCSHLLEAVQVRMDEQATLTVGTNAIFGVFVTVPCLVLVVDWKWHPEIGQIFMIHRRKRTHVDVLKSSGPCAKRHLDPKWQSACSNQF